MVTAGSGGSGADSGAGGPGLNGAGNFPMSERSAAGPATRMKSAGICPITSSSGSFSTQSGKRWRTSERGMASARSGN